MGHSSQATLAYQERAPAEPTGRPVAPRRGRRLLTGILTTLLSRGIGVLLPLVLIPITLSYLGADLFGLWMAAASVTGMAAFADLGLGNGLMTKLAPCYSNGDTARAARYISSAYLTLVPIAAGLVCLLWMSSGLVPWAAVFNVAGSATPAQARGIALACLSMFILNIPLSLVVRVQYAYQMMGQSNLWQAAGSVSALPLALAAVHAHLSPVAVVAAAVSGPPLANVANTVWLFGRQRPDLAPRLRSLDRAAARELLALSGLFLVLTVVSSLATNSDALVIAHALGLRSVTAYAVPARLFSQLGVLMTIVNLPLWPANGDALAQGDLVWVRRVTRRMTLVSGLLVLVASAVLVLAGDTVISLWLGGSLGTDRRLLSGLAVWWAVLAMTSPRFMVQNAGGVLGPQLFGWLAYLVLSIPLKWLGATSWGLAGVPYAGAATYACTVLPSAIVGYRRTVYPRYRGRHRGSVRR